MTAGSTVVTNPAGTEYIAVDTANAISTVIAQGNAIQAALVTLGIIKGG